MSKRRLFFFPEFGMRISVDNYGFDALPQTLLSSSHPPTLSLSELLSDGESDRAKKS